jgi:hypothetical protein
VDIVNPREALIMARKKVENPPMPAVEAKPKPIRLALSPDLHQQFRVEAALQGTNMAILARRIIEEYLAKHATRGGRR